MSLETFIEINRDVLTQTIRARLGDADYAVSDNECRLWVLNDEELYVWALNTGVQFED